jgi:hypothetical protein
MPSTSPKMKRTMRAADHDPQFAAKMGIPKTVAHEFAEADKAKDSKSKKRSPSAAPKPMPHQIAKTPTHGYGR